MVIIWRPQASEALWRIYDFYAIKEEKAARKILTTILNAVDKLSAFPEMAAVEQALVNEPEGYRSLVAHKLFKVVYMVDKEREEVVIVDIWDCRQNPDFLKRGITG